MHITFFGAEVNEVDTQRWACECVSLAKGRVLEWEMKKNEEIKKTKNLSSLKFNLKHMADAGATNSDNHGMHIN